MCCYASLFPAQCAVCGILLPQGPSTQYFRTLVPKAIKDIWLLEPESLKYCVLGPAGAVLILGLSFPAEL